MTKSNYIWANDLNKNSGEGILGRLFLREIFIKKDKYTIESPLRKIKSIGKLNKNFPIKNSFLFKYFYPIIGAIKVRFKKNKYHKLYYVNYLPLWNFLIFIILPKETRLGPITGRSLENNSGKKSYLLFFFYNISIFIIKKKFKFIIFSTSILKKYLNLKKNDKKYYFFDFALMLYPKFLSNNKNYRPIDILIYNRIHSNKSLVIENKILKQLSYNLNIYCIGDKIKYLGIKNLGYLGRKKVFSLMKKTKAIVSTTENFFSFFVIDGLFHGCKIIVEKFNTNFYFNRSHFILKKEIRSIKKLRSLLEKKIDNKKNNQIKILQKNYKKFKKNFL